MKKFLELDKDYGMIDIKSIIFITKRLDSSMSYILIHTDGGSEIKLYYYNDTDRDKQFNKLVEEIKNISKVVRKEKCETFTYS